MAKFIIVFVVMMVLGMMLGFALSLPVTPIFCLLRKIFYVPFIRKRLKEKAEAEGRVVIGKLVKTHYNSPHRHYYSVYEYEYMGRKYSQKIKNALEPSKELKLYFLRNPKHACSGAYLGDYEDNWRLYYLVLSVAFGIIFGLVGVGYVFMGYL